MEKLTHWTEDSADDFLHSIGADFIRFIETTMGDSVTQSELARRLGVTEGRVSQVLNNPGNLTLKKIVEYARALRVKVSIVGYDDHDPGNLRGPIHSDIFTKCWERVGCPADFHALGTYQSAETRSKNYRFNWNFQRFFSTDLPSPEGHATTTGNRRLTAIGVSDG